MLLNRTRRIGLKTQYILADVWFDTKSNIEAVIRLKLTGISRMKNSRMKNRLNGKLL